MMVEWLFLAVPRGCLRFVILVFPDHTHLLFLLYCVSIMSSKLDFFSGEFPVLPVSLICSASAVYK